MKTMSRLAAGPSGRLHYHTLDRVNGMCHVHETAEDLDLYFQATGPGMMETTHCY